MNFYENFLFISFSPGLLAATQLGCQLCELSVGLLMFMLIR